MDRADQNQARELDLLKLTWPILIETTLFMLLGFVDVFVLGRYDDLAAAGVNAANQAITIISVVFLVFSSAGGILISQHLGAGQRKQASRSAALSLLLHLFTGVLISIIVFRFRNPILRFIGVKDQVYEYAVQYLSLAGAFLFLKALLNSEGVTIRSHGKTRWTMLVAMGVNVLNIILDLILVPGMGAKGAALATVICWCVSTVVLGFILFTKVESPKIFRLLSDHKIKELKLYLKLGLPSAAESFLYHMSQLIITSLVLHYLSETELIAKTYLSNITFLFYLFSASIGQAAQIVVGHLAGAKDFEGARKLGFRAFRLAIIVTAITSLLGILFRVPIISLFTSNPEVIQVASKLLIVNFLLELGRTTNLTIITCLRGAGDVMFPTLWAVFSNWVIGLGGSYVMAVTMGLGIFGLWFAMAFDECFRAVLMLIRWKSGRWERKRSVA